MSSREPFGIQPELFLVLKVYLENDVKEVLKMPHYVNQCKFTKNTDLYKSEVGSAYECTVLYKRKRERM